MSVTGWQGLDADRGARLGERTQQDAMLPDPCHGPLGEHPCLSVVGARNDCELVAVNPVDQVALAS